MSTITRAQPATTPGALTLTEVYRMTVNEYERMASAGALDDDRVELLDGYLVTKMGKNPPHCWATRELLDRLALLLPPDWTWRQEQPLRIPEYDEPEPDIAIVRGANSDYKARAPEPKDVTLLVEVADTTLSRDRGRKLSAYAAAGIPVYWIVNLVDRQVEVYSGPGPAGYQSRVDFTIGNQVPVVIGGQQRGLVAVDAILP
jgi:Uma2 family endonuclease